MKKKQKNQYFLIFWKSDKAKKEVEKELINKKINLEKDKDSEDNNNEDKETNDKTDYNKFLSLLNNVNLYYSKFVLLFLLR